MGYVSRDEHDPHFSKLCGHRKLDLIRALAAGYPKPVMLAKEAGVSVQAITNFRRRNKRMIDAMAAMLDDEWAGLWIAQKRARLAELELMAEILGDAILDNPDPDMIKARASLLKQASEELGQLPPRQQVVSAQVTHRVEGFSSDELKDLLT